MTRVDPLFAAATPAELVQYAERPSLSDRWSKQIVGVFVVANIACVVEVREENSVWLVMGASLWREMAQISADGAKSAPLAQGLKVTEIEDPDAAPEAIRLFVRGLTACAVGLVALPLAAANAGAGR